LTEKKEHFLFNLPNHIKKIRLNVYTL